MNDVQVVQPGSAASGAGSRLLSRDRLLQFGVLWALVIVLIGAAIVYPRVFEPRNVQNILSQAAPVGIVSVGMTFVMIGGGFDLSVGSTLALGAVVFAHLADPLGLWGAAAAVLLASIVCGVINGLIVTKLRVNPFVATLGTGSVFGGYAFIYSNSAPQVPNDFNFQYIGTESWFGWPISIYILIVIFLFGAFALARTVYGRSIYALGGNNEAARLSGIPVDFLRASTYVMTAICSGIGGIILSSRLGVGQADMGGSTALDSIAIVVIGGTSLLGGEGAMWRTAVGLLIIGTLTNVFDALAVNNNYQLVAKGMIVIGAVALDIYARRMRG
jgi:ribose transport system permease protein